jgi:hypothetical protein
VARTDLKGTELGSQRVVVERGPVRVFATAIKDDAAAYQADEGAPVPPTYPFSWAYWGHDGGEVGGLPIGELRGPGRMMLHGEQEFVYHRWPKVGDVLVGTGRVRDVYEKAGGSATMEFYVTDTEWRDAETDEPVVTVSFTLIVRDTTRTA